MAIRQRGGILHFYRTIAPRATDDRFTSTGRCQTWTAGREKNWVKTWVFRSSYCTKGKRARVASIAVKYNRQNVPDQFGIISSSRRRVVHYRTAGQWSRRRRFLSPGVEFSFLCGKRNRCNIHSRRRRRNFFHFLLLLFFSTRF